MGCRPLLVVVAFAAVLALPACRSETAPAPPSPSPQATEPVALHDHTPHHGGVVGMAGSLHVEASARAADGSVRAWVTDFWRKPVPLDGASGTVTLDLAGAEQQHALSIDEGGLAVVGLPLAGDAVDARFELQVGGEPVLIEFYLPIASGVRGAAGVPVSGCKPVASEVKRGVVRLPRCVLPFHRDVGAIAATPGGDRALIAALDAGVSEWAMPAVDLLFSFAPPPPMEVRGEEALQPHRELASALAVSPDGREAVVAIENRLLRYAVLDGTLLRELAAAPGVVRDLAWSPDGATLLVATFYDPAARLVRAVDGAEERALAVEREASAVAFSPDGGSAAVASEAGGIELFAIGSGARRLRLDSGPHPVQAMAFVARQGGPWLLAGGRDGIVRAFDAASGEPRGQSPAGRPILRIAVASPAVAASDSDVLVAASGQSGDLRLLRPDGTAVESLRWHGTEVTGLAWAAGTLISGDTGGRIAIWDLAGLLRPQGR